MEFIISDIMVFTFAVFLLLVTPGPGVLSMAIVTQGKWRDLINNLEVIYEKTKNIDAV